MSVGLGIDFELQVKAIKGLIARHTYIEMVFLLTNGFADHNACVYLC